MIQHIETNGKRLPINFGIRVMATTADAMGMSFNGLCEKMDVENPPLADMLQLIISAAVIALNEGARIDNTGERFSEDDVVDLIDGDPKLLPEISRMMMQAMHPMETGFTTAGSSPKKTPAVKKKP